jgi:hypothetical protein
MQDEYKAKDRIDIKATAKEKVPSVLRKIKLY